jgi:hypothetical protein
MVSHNNTFLVQRLMTEKNPPANWVNERYKEQGQDALKWSFK